MATRKREYETWLPDSAPASGFAIGSVPPFWVLLGRHFAHCHRHGELGIVTGALGIVIGLCVIWLKFRMITHKKIPEDTCRNWNQKYIILTSGSVIYNSILGAYSATDEDIFTKFVSVENGVLDVWNSPNTLPSNIQDGNRYNSAADCLFR